MKKLGLLIVCILLVSALGAALAGCGGEDGEKSEYGDFVANIEEHDMLVNNKPAKNYVVQLKSDTDWAALTDEERSGIARYGVKEALKKAEEAGVEQYVIFGGITEEADPATSEGGVSTTPAAPIERVFAYDGISRVIIYIHGDVSTEIELDEDAAAASGEEAPAEDGEAAAEEGEEAAQ